MPRRKRPLNPEARDGLDRLKQEVSEDLGLDDDVQRRGWENMTTGETGAIGGQMVRRMVRGAEDDLARTVRHNQRGREDITRRDESPRR